MPRTTLQIARFILHIDVRSAYTLVVILDLARTTTDRVWPADRCVPGNVIGAVDPLIVARRLSRCSISGDFPLGLNVQLRPRASIGRSPDDCVDRLGADMARSWQTTAGPRCSRPRFRLAYRGLDTLETGSAELMRMIVDGPIIRRAISTSGSSWRACEESDYLRKLRARLLTSTRAGNRVFSAETATR